MRPGSGSRKKSPATIEKYTRYTKAFILHAGRNPLTKDLVLSFKEYIVSGYTAAGANGVIAAVNSFLSFLGKTELRVKPLRIQRRLFVPREKELSRGEYEKLLSEAERQNKKRLAAVILTLFATGIRVSELQYITTEALAQGHAEIRMKGKTRTIILTGKLCARLHAYAHAQGITSGPIFVTRSGRALDRSNIWKEMKRLCGQARIAAAKVFPHNLRHLFARIYYRKIPDLVGLAGIMGHSDINTTRIYTAATGAECRRRLESLHLVV